MEKTLHERQTNYLLSVLYQVFYFNCRCKEILLPLRVYRLSPPHLPLSSTVTSSNGFPIHMCLRELVWLQVIGRLVFKKRTHHFRDNLLPSPSERIGRHRLSCVYSCWTKPI